MDLLKPDPVTEVNNDEVEVKDEDEDLEALRMAALNSIKPKKPSGYVLQKHPVRNNLVSIVTVEPPEKKERNSVSASSAEGKFSRFKDKDDDEEESEESESEYSEYSEYETVTDDDEPAEDVQERDKNGSGIPSQQREKVPDDVLQLDASAEMDELLFEGDDEDDKEKEEKNKKKKTKKVRVVKRRKKVKRRPLSPLSPPPPTQNQQQQQQQQQQQPHLHQHHHHHHRRSPPPYYRPHHHRSRSPMMRSRSPPLYHHHQQRPRSRSRSRSPPRRSRSPRCTSPGCRYGARSRSPYYSPLRRPPPRGYYPRSRSPPPRRSYSPRPPPRHSRSPRPRGHSPPRPARGSPPPLTDKSKSLPPPEMKSNGEKVKPAAAAEVETEADREERLFQERLKNAANEEEKQKMIARREKFSNKISPQDSNYKKKISLKSLNANKSPQRTVLGKFLLFTCGAKPPEELYSKVSI